MNKIEDYLKKIGYLVFFKKVSFRKARKCFYKSNTYDDLEIYSVRTPFPDDTKIEEIVSKTSGRKGYWFYEECYHPFRCAKRMM